MTHRMLPINSQLHEGLRLLQTFSWDSEAHSKNNLTVSRLHFTVGSALPPSLPRSHLPDDGDELAHGEFLGDKELCLVEQW